MTGDMDGVADVLQQPSEETRVTALRWISSGGTRIVVQRGSIVGFSVMNPTFFGMTPSKCFRYAKRSTLRCGEHAAGHGKCSAQHREAVHVYEPFSNSPMQAVLDRLGWESVGIVYGLDDADPDLCYKAPPR